MARILIYYEQRGYGGVDTHMAHLINNWPSENDHFTVVSNHDNEGLDFFKAKLARSNVDIRTIYFGKRDLNQGRLSRLLFLVWYKNITFVFHLMQMLIRLKPDVLISNNGGYPGGTTCFVSALIGRLILPKLHTYLLVHHAPILCGRFNRMYADILAFLIRILKIPLITVSKASKIALEENTPLKGFKVIYNGLEVVTRVADKINLRERYNIPATRLIIGLVGPIDPHKGHAVIVESFRQSKLLQEKAHLLFVGSGGKSLLESLREKIKVSRLFDFITFTGFIQGEVASIIEQFDIFAMPTTDFEGFGYSLAEAMALGIPVVASRVGAIPEIIKDGENGVLVDPNEAESLRVALEDIIRKPEYRKKMGVEGKKRIEGHFGARKMAQEYYDFVIT